MIPQARSYRLAGKPVAGAADLAHRRRGEMRRAAQRVGVAIAFEEAAARDACLRLVEVELDRHFRIARLQRRMHQIAGEYRVILAAAEGEGEMAGGMARCR